MHTIDNPQGLSPNLIYSYDRKTNESWNLPQYRVPRQYLDSAKQAKQRQMTSQKKGEKDRKHVTKRGFYMDYDLKVATNIPASNKHGQNKPWTFEKLLAISKHRKVDPKLIKRSFLDQIEIQQKNRKKPGVGTYSLQKSQKQKDKQLQQFKKKKFFVGEKHFYHDDISFLGEKLPGSGNYNPHDHISKIRLNKTDYKFWIKKHKQQWQKNSKRDEKIPAPGTYNPMSATFTTFELFQKTQKDNEKSKSKQKSSGFGTDARFEYTREQKKKIKQKRPDPISYNTAYEWRSKNSSPKSKLWNESISKGFVTMSVYH